MHENNSHLQIINFEWWFNLQSVYHDEMEKFQLHYATNQPTNPLRGFSLRANYTDRATAACRRS
jgi:hypothetical protein